MTDLEKLIEMQKFANQSLLIRSRVNMLKEIHKLTEVRKQAENALQNYRERVKETLKMKSVYEMTIDELRDLPLMRVNERVIGISSLIFVPMGEAYLDRPEYSCMKYIFLDDETNIIGVVGGQSDALFIYGLLTGGLMTSVGFDCLEKSGCIRAHGLDVSYNGDGFSSIITLNR